MNNMLAHLRDTCMTVQKLTVKENLANGGIKTIKTRVDIPAKVFKVADLLRKQ